MVRTPRDRMRRPEELQSRAIGRRDGSAGIRLSGSVDGHVRAYSSRTGAILWDYDTARSFETVNGVKANGGSLDAAGPTIAGGMLFVNSGYGLYGGMGGNVLIAFAPRR
jgi:polyvinyl alcohol dehydrogenase (cytochrome)